MSRRRGHKGEIAFQLFSFLDVLLCTIGALIIILTIVIHRARAQASEEQARQAAPSPELLKKQAQALEDARWRQEQLQQNRVQKQAELQDARLTLSHLEDHIRRLTAKGNELLDLLEQVKSGKQAKEEDLEAAKNELAKIKGELAKKRDDLEKKKKDIATAEKWYALIPYDGPNGTRRMPIYIECVEEGVVIQPEGVLLTADDFRGEPGPGNPLDAALRTKREYIMKATGGKAAEPYPLLVVRPSGVLSYSTARAFMKFWDDEFGYELIAEDKKLDFGPRDPNLDLVMHREIAEARKRQAVLAMAMPRKYNNEQVPRSFAPEHNPDVQRRRTAVAGNGVGNGGSGNGIGGSGTGAGGLAGTNPTRQRGSSAGTANAPRSGIGPYGSGGDPLGGSGPGGPNPGDSASGGNNSASATSGSSRLRQPNQGGTSPGAGSYADGTPGGTSESGSTSRPGSVASGNNPSQGGASGGASPSASGSSGATSNGASGGASAGAGSPTGSAASGQSMPNISVNMGPAENAPASNSRKTAKDRGGSGNSPRGKNWGLPEAQRHVTGVTRPLRVTMQKDKLILLPEVGDQRKPQVIPL
ncbi:MAG: hypothetical protein IAF94_20430, partial [Pirellulaceae bacterium]|nr:hypothetical protein [Pirellulaceae bacterium]